jgi:ABC-type polysaccharide/polyol phosphate transport system ATPase subunit
MSTSAMPSSIKNVSIPDTSVGKDIQLEGVGVRYLLLTEDQRTFKGRALNLLRSTPLEAAQFWALQNIDLKIGQGEVVGIIGRNGSGKSTLLRVISRIITPTTGTVAVNGSICPLLELGCAFNSELTGRENARLYGAMFKISKEQMDEMMPRIIEFSELGAFFDIPIKTYSSGMVARLAFSVSTQLRPDILLIDEVLSVGDQEFQKKCFFRIRKMIDRGSIVALVSHGSDLIERLCSRVIYLSRGQVAADGKPHTVIETYHREAAAGL